LYNTQGYGKGILTCLHRGVFVKIGKDIIITFLIRRMLISLHAIEVNRGHDYTCHAATGAW
jgi:hypothetical protein